MADKKKTETKAIKEEKKEVANAPPSFDWKKHLDPKNTEFFVTGQPEKLFLLFS